MRQRSVDLEAARAREDESHSAGNLSIKDEGASEVVSSDGESGHHSPLVESTEVDVLVENTADSRHLVGAIFTVLGIISRFAYLNWPAEVIFDEVHFGKFVSGYIRGIYFFDIHPPLAKLLLALFAASLCV